MDHEPPLIDMITTRGRVATGRYHYLSLLNLGAGTREEVAGCAA